MNLMTWPCHTISHPNTVLAGLLPLRDRIVDWADLGPGSTSGIPLSYLHHRSTAQLPSTHLSFPRRKGRFLQNYLHVELLPLKIPYTPRVHGFIVCHPRTKRHSIPAPRAGLLDQRIPHPLLATSTKSSPYQPTTTTITTAKVQSTRTIVSVFFQMWHLPATPAAASACPAWGDFSRTESWRSTTFVLLPPSATSRPDESTGSSATAAASLCCLLGETPFGATVIVLESAVRLTPELVRGSAQPASMAAWGTFEAPASTMTTFLSTTLQTTVRAGRKTRFPNLPAPSYRTHPTSAT